MKIIPIGDKVILKAMKAEEKTKSGLYIPKGTEEKKQALVEEVGQDKDGRPLPLKKGDRVIYSGYSSEEIELEGEKYIIVEFKDIAAKLE
ncbi:MAG: co-chaperone GroES [Nanoarchaeota archaeon]|nr:co-chaperone GroES [Nanoarchaeota archaeon]